MRKLKTKTAAALLAVGLLCFALEGCGNQASGQTPASAVTVLASLSNTLSLGTKYLSELSYDSAILQYTAVIQEDPQNLEAYAGLYAAYAASGRMEEANDVLDAAQEAIGDDALLIPVILEDADMIYTNGGGLDAIRYLSDRYAEKLDETNGVLLEQINRAWVDKEPENAEAYVALCLLYANQGDQEQMNALLGKAEENGTDMDALNTRVVARSDGKVTLQIQVNNLEIETPGSEGKKTETPITVEVPVDSEKPMDAQEVTTQISEGITSQMIEDVIESSGIDLDSFAGQVATDMAQSMMDSVLGSVPGIGD